jgi:transcriptional regulator with XRE-family HTH domain
MQEDTAVAPVLLPNDAQGSSESFPRPAVPCAVQPVAVDRTAVHGNVAPAGIEAQLLSRRSDLGSVESTVASAALSPAPNSVERRKLSVNVIARRLAAVLQARGMTQGQLCERMGYYPAFISLWKNGHLGEAKEQQASRELLAWLEKSEGSAAAEPAESTSDSELDGASVDTRSFEVSSDDEPQQRRQRLPNCSSSSSSSSVSDSEPDSGESVDVGAGKPTTHRKLVALALSQMRRRGMSQAGLGLAVGCSASTLSQWKNARLGPTMLQILGERIWDWLRNAAPAPAAARKDEARAGLTLAGDASGSPTPAASAAAALTLRAQPSTAEILRMVTAEMTRRGWGQTAVGEAVGLAQATISGWKTGKLSATRTNEVSARLWRWILRVNGVKSESVADAKPDAADVDIAGARTDELAPPVTLPAVAACEPRAMPSPAAQSHSSPDVPTAVPSQPDDSKLNDGDLVKTALARVFGRGLTQLQWAMDLGLNPG